VCPIYADIGISLGATQQGAIRIGRRVTEERRAEAVDHHQRPIRLPTGEADRLYGPVVRRDRPSRPVNAPGRRSSGVARGKGR
jgi:hypothetical protein